MNVFDQYHLKVADVAKTRNCTVEYATSRKLQLDLDSDDAWERYHRRVSRLWWLVSSAQHWYSNKRGNRHVEVHLRCPLPVTLRILLQWWLGSDRKREWLSFKRVLNGDHRPLLLFRPRDAQATEQMVTSRREQRRVARVHCELVGHVWVVRERESGGYVEREELCGRCEEPKHKPKRAWSGY